MLREKSCKLYILANIFSRFYTYGNFPLETHLQTINESIMNQFEKIIPNTDIPVEPKWNEPVWASIYQ